MLTAPIPVDEAERLADLRALQLLDTPPERRFDRIVHLARRVFDVPIAYIALIDSDRQWFKSKCGLKYEQTDRDISFCGHAIMQDEPLIVTDARLDARFVDNPMVTGEPHVRFYAGHPLRGPSGTNIGTLCLVDRRPRRLDDNQMTIFAELAAQAEHELKMVDLIKAQRELLETKNALVATQRRLADELAEAADYVCSMLPSRWKDGSVRTDYRFIASSQLGGDLLGYHWLDDDRLAMYLLDVTGHGVGSALLSVAVHSTLRRGTLPNTDFTQPDQVLAALNRAFPMTEHQGKFFTIWYGVYEKSTRRLACAAGGHPPAIIFEPGADEPVSLGTGNLIVGVLDDADFRTQSRTIPPGSRMFLYSDGVYEIPDEDGALLMLDGLRRVLADANGAGDGSRVDRVVDRARRLQGSDDFKDDFSLLEVEFE